MDLFCNRYRIYIYKYIRLSPHPQPCLFARIRLPTQPSLLPAIVSQFRLTTPNYLDIGATIAKLGLPTLFVMEGGYALDDIGDAVVNVLVGFEGAKQ